MKVLQLGMGVGVCLPVASVLSSGSVDGLTFGEIGLMGSIVAGTLAVGGSTSWYCEKFVGELSWRPAERALRVSTLNVWGSRVDRDIPLAQLAELLSPSFVPSEDVPTPLDERRKLLPFHVGADGRYMVLLHRESFREPDAVFELLAGRIPSEWKDGVGSVPVRAASARPARLHDDH